MIGRAALCGLCAATFAAWPAPCGAIASRQETMVVSPHDGFGPLDFDPSIPLRPQAALHGWGARSGLTIGWALTSLLAARGGVGWFPAIPVMGLSMMLMFERAMEGASMASPGGLSLDLSDPLSRAFHIAVASMTLVLLLSSARPTVEITPEGALVSNMMVQTSTGESPGISGGTIMFRALAAPIDQIMNLVWSHFRPGQPLIWHVRIGPFVNDGKVTGVVGGLALVL